jgi:hypothetical protein
MFLAPPRANNSCRALTLGDVHRRLHHPRENEDEHDSIEDEFWSLPFWRFCVLGRSGFEAGLISLRKGLDRRSRR